MKNVFIQFKEGIFISLRAIKVNKMRSVLTTLGIIIGIFAVTTMSTAIVGLREAFVSTISNFGSDVLYVGKYPWMSGRDWRLFRNRKEITLDQYEALKEKLPSYKAIAPYISTFSETVKYKSKSVQTTALYGSTEKYLITANTLPEKGRFFNEYEVEANRKVCIIGKDIEDALFSNEDPLNKLVKINGDTYKVIGVLEKQGSGFLGMFSMDGQVIIPISAFMQTLGKSRSGIDIQVKVADPAKMNQSKEELIAVMRVIRKVAPNEPDDFAVNQQEQFKEIYDNLVGVIALAGIVITALSLFVGAIGIMNIMFVSVKERTREIGIRKAVGAKTWSILVQFLAEAAFLCILGGLIGIAISFPVSLIINQFLPTSMPLGIVALSIFISAVVGIVSGFLPAYKASKLDPVEALRFE